MQQKLFKPLFPTATFSEDRKYRYTLYREWNQQKGMVMIIGLNPSTADETKDDPTIRRCLNFAKDWGFGRLMMVNLFAIRGTDPQILKEVSDPIGPQNDFYLKSMAEKSDLIIGAWGVDGVYKNRGVTIKKLIPDMNCLGITKNGQPKHPLYLKKDTKWMEWNIGTIGE